MKKVSYLEKGATIKIKIGDKKHTGKVVAIYRDFMTVRVPNRVIQTVHWEDYFEVIDNIKETVK